MRKLFPTTKFLKHQPKILSLHQFPHSTGCQLVYVSINEAFFLKGKKKKNPT